MQGRSIIIGLPCIYFLLLLIRRPVDNDESREIGHATHFMHHVFEENNQITGDDNLLTPRGDDAQLPLQHKHHLVKIRVCMPFRAAVLLHHANDKLHVIRVAQSAGRYGRNDDAG